MNFAKLKTVKRKMIVSQIIIIYYLSNWTKFNLGLWWYWESFIFLSAWWKIYFLLIWSWNTNVEHLMFSQLFLFFRQLRAILATEYTNKHRTVEQHHLCHLDTIRNRSQHFFVAIPKFERFQLWRFCSKWMY